MSFVSGVTTLSSSARLGRQPCSASSGKASTFAPALIEQPHTCKRQGGEHYYLHASALRREGRCCRLSGTGLGRDHATAAAVRPDTSGHH